MEAGNLPENQMSGPYFLVWRGKLYRKEERDGRRRKARRQWDNEGTKNDRKRTNNNS